MSTVTCVVDRIFPGTYIDDVTIYATDYKTAHKLFAPIRAFLEFTDLVPGVSSLGLVIQGVENAYNITMDAYIEKNAFYLWHEAC